MIIKEFKDLDFDEVKDFVKHLQDTNTIKDSPDFSVSGWKETKSVRLCGQFHRRMKLARCSPKAQGKLEIGHQKL